MIKNRHEVTKIISKTENKKEKSTFFIFNRKKIAVNVLFSVDNKNSLRK